MEFRYKSKTYSATPGGPRSLGPSACSVRHRLPRSGRWSPATGAGLGAKRRSAVSESGVDAYYFKAVTAINIYTFKY